MTPVVKPLAERAVSAATPVVKAGADYVGRAAGPIVSDAASKVSGAASGAANSAGAAIKAQGIDVEPAVSIVGKAAGAVGAAASSVLPSVDDVTGFLTTASPTELAEVAGGAAAIYLLSPVLLGVLGGVLRGYAGSTRPVEAYDLVTSGKCVIVDIRADTGRGEIKVPRGKVLSIPREKLSGSFAGDVEANLTALKVASLKGVKKGTKVLILDANGGGDATKVAKALASQGFGKTFVVQVASTAGPTRVSPSTAKRSLRLTSTRLHDSIWAHLLAKKRLPQAHRQGEAQRLSRGREDALPITLVHDYQYHRSSAACQ